MVSCNNQCKPNFEEQRLGPQLHQLLHHGLVHELDVRPVRKLMNAGVHVQPPWVIIECGTWGLNHQKFAPDMCFPREFPAKVRNGKFPKQVPSLVRPPQKKNSESSSNYNRSPGRSSLKKRTCRGMASTYSTEMDGLG